MVIIEDYRKARIVLQNFVKQYAKSLGEIGSGENYDGMPAYHPAVTEMNASAKTERVGSAMYYVHWVKRTINRMANGGFDKEARILRDKYLRIRPLTDFRQYMRLNIQSAQFYRVLKHSLYLFSDVCPTYIFNQLFNKVNDRLMID